MCNKDVAMNNNVLLFGKNSNIGSAIAKYLLSEGLIVRSFDSKDCDFLDKDGSSDFFKGLPAGPCTIVFLSVISKWLRNDYVSFLENVAIVNNFIQAQTQVNVKSIIYFSSVDVYGVSPELPVTEKTAIDPDTWFGLAKYCCEHEFKLSPLIKCPVTILRIPGVYGNPHNDRSAISRLINDAVDKKEVTIFGSGKILRDYVHAQDISSIVKYFIQKPFSGVLNLVTGKSSSLLEIVELIRQKVAGSFKIVHTAPDSGREFDLKFDNSKLMALVPEFRFMNLDKGMQSYLLQPAQKEKM